MPPARTPRKFLAPGTAASLAANFRQNSQYRYDPIRWVEDELGERMWSKQREVARSLVEHRYTAVQSCHDVGKSYTASRLASWWLKVHPVGEAFVVTTAPTTSQVRAILWREIGKARKKANLPGDITTGQIPEWKINGELVAYGRKPADHDQSAFQGIHAKYVLVIIDEACGVPKSLYEAVDALATNANARVLAIGNPDDPNAHFRNVCTKGHKAEFDNVIQISAYDWFAEMDQYPELQALMISPEWVDERKKRWGEQSAIYKSKVLGEFPGVSDRALITPAMLQRAHVLDLPGTAKGHYALDVARFGDDETVLYRNRGGVVRHEWSMRGADTMATADRLAGTLAAHQGGVGSMVDVIGVGGGVYDRVKQLGLPVAAFNASEKARRPEKFKNRRAEAFWGLRTMLMDGELDLDPDDFELSAQLLGIEYFLEPTSSKIQIESKDDMKKRGVSSPDRADAVMMATGGASPADLSSAIPIGGASITEDLLNEPT